ncbi:MAG: ATP-binding protein, partial [Candidatus Helarchaeota archaeon]
MTLNESLKTLDKESEVIGVIGSPSSTNRIQIDILDNASNKKLVGSFCYFMFQQDDVPHVAFGQLTEVNLRNRWTEDPIMKGLIRHKGKLEPITQRQDTHTAILNIGAVLSIQDKVAQSVLGTIPPTGTEIKFASDRLFDELLKDYKDQLTYLGKIYGTSNNLPMWFKEFKKSPRGLGEAYHLGIFGKTGSGKSVLAKMILIAYARNKNMSIFLLDPQGEFAKAFRDEDPVFKDILENKLKRKVEVYDIQQIVLPGKDLFERILVNSKFFETYFTFPRSYPEIYTRTARLFTNILSGVKNFKKYDEIPPWRYYELDSFNRIMEEIKDPEVQKRIYYSKEPRTRFASILESINEVDLLKDWIKISALFAYKKRKNSIKLNDLLKNTFEEDQEKIVIIDLSKEQTPDYFYWDENVQLIIIHALLERLQDQAESQFKIGKKLNSLVVIDEAHRLIPRFRTDDENLELIKNSFIDAVRTTRKYGLGWLFISQSLGSLHWEILKQLRAYFFGYGLAWGSELRSLQDLIGGNHEAIKLYQSFKDPQSSIGEIKEYSFMTFGPVSPLSYSGSPLFFTA